MTVTIQPYTPPADARAYITNLLSRYGLESLADRAWQQMQSGVSDDEAIQWIREQPEYAARFPGISQRRTKNLPAISENEYLAFERQALQLMRGAGLPEQFFDQPEDFANFIGNDVSVNELAQRINMARDMVYNSPAEVRDEAFNFYGLGEGDLVAAFLDEQRALPLLERKFRAVQAAGAAIRTGFGRLNQQEAEGLAQQGVTQEQAQQGFTNLANQSELFRSLDRGEQEISRVDQLAAQFGGNAPAQQKVEQRAKRRVAEFSRGGGYAGSQRGYGGLG